MRRRLLVVALAAMMAMATGAGSALAGEVKGPPGPGGAEGGTTPIDGFFTGDGAASICSFSGLNDVIDEEEPTQTQTFGTFLVLIKKTFDLSPAEAREILEGGPGVACNPNTFGNPKK